MVEKTPTTPMLNGEASRRLRRGARRVEKVKVKVPGDGG